jgi:phospholipase C
MREALSVSLVALLIFGNATSGFADNGKNGNNGKDKDAADNFKTETPIKHVIILIGENRGLDHTFGVYKPKGRHQTILNLLSEGIVNENGTPGPNFAAKTAFGQPVQNMVVPQANYYIGPPDGAKMPFGNNGQMPQPNTNGAPQVPGTTSGPFTSVAIVQAAGETDLDSGDLNLLTTGATGLPQKALDTRFPNAGTLPNGPYLMQGPNISDDDYTGDTTHRFYQAWQQSDCSVANANKVNRSGCLNDLFPFVMATYDFNNASHTQGNFSEGNEMGFYDAEQGQASLFNTLADRFTLSDNFHQSFQGGTGANHFMLGTGDAGFWSDGNGNATPAPSTLVANPNPVSGTNNQYQVDGNFSNCSDAFQPGVGPIVDYIDSLPFGAEPNCAENHFYMLNNTNPGFLPNGFQAPLPAAQNMLPGSPVRTIGDALDDKNISWAYFGGAFNDAVALSNDAVKAGTAQTLNSSTALALAAASDPAHALGVAYCQICNPFQYATSIMGNTAERAAHVKDTTDLIADIQNDTLPAVSFGKPDGLLDGHPQSSKIDLFEAYTQHLLEALEANPKLKAETAVFITWDEAGGYWDSGYIQPIDFFGDGPRIPLLVLSPWSSGGMINHGYADHVSLVKFIERNWHLKPLTDRSRDNLPNPKQGNDGDADDYVPRNQPALSDLFDAFDFDHAVKQKFFE